jgi:hypothetical protein
MRSILPWILAAFLCVFVQSADAKDTYVHGYYRSNGTYVSPHYRSAPDGDFSNNWSTRGNINPYTGKMGTKDYPSSGYGGFNPTNTFGNTSPPLLPSSAAPYQTPNCSSGTVPINTGGMVPSLSALDESNRISVANRLTNMGYNVDWQKHSLAQMMDLESRIGISNRLQAMGENVPWQHRSLSDLLDIQSRIEASKRLQQMGQSVDWKTHSLGEMLNLEMNAAK